MADVNKRVWPSEVRRSDDVARLPKNTIRKKKKNNQKIRNKRQNDRLLRRGGGSSGPELRGLTLSPRGPLSPVRPCSSSSSKSRRGGGGGGGGGEEKDESDREEKWDQTLTHSSATTSELLPKLKFYTKFIHKVQNCALCDVLHRVKNTTT